MNRREFLKAITLMPPASYGMRVLLSGQTCNRKRAQANSTEKSGLPGVSKDSLCHCSAGPQEYEVKSSSLSQTVASRAFEWIIANLSRFDPFSWKPVLGEQSQTALAELALMCFLLSRHNDPNKDLRLAKCLDVLEHAYKQPPFHEYIFRIDKRAFSGHLLIWLSLAGRKSEAVVSHDRLQQFIDEYGVACTERIPYRLLELRYLLDKGGFVHNLPPEEDIFRQTTLACNFNIVTIAPYDLYSITHSIFYLSDFGAIVPAALEFQEKTRILELIRSLIGISICSGNWDLVSELILSYRCLTNDAEYWIDLGWKALERIQDKSGFIPGLAFSFEKHKELPSETEREQYLFIRNYHATLMTCLAGFLGKGSRV